MVLANYGEDYGKLYVISDVLDQNRVLVDSPEMTRKVESLRRLSLTDQKVEIPRLASKKVLRAKLTESGALAKFQASSWGKKLAKQTAKASMNDFDRFKATMAKMMKARAVRKVVNQLKKASQNK
jgi:large subunit ribosomal protein L14e